MGGYYANVTNISGAKSSVATSAYMSREKLKDEQMNHTFNYSAHAQDNTFSNVRLCPNAPEEWQDKEKLWNAVEEAEKGKNTRKAKQWILAIPQELTQEQQQEAVKQFQDFLAENGMCSQADIHEAESTRSKSQIEKNKHVHVLATQRLLNEQGEWEKTKQKQEYANDVGADGKPIYNPEKPTDTEHRIPKVDPEKVAEWEKSHGHQFDMRTATAEDKAEVQKIGARNRKEWVRVTTESNSLYRAELIEESRQKWADICNQYLSAEQKIDNRSYERQGIEKISELHEGVGTHKDFDDRVEYNRTVREANESMAEIKQERPEEIKSIKENLHGIRQSLEHDRDSRRTETASFRTARSDYATGTGASGTEKVTLESRSDRRFGEEEKRAEQQQRSGNSAVEGASVGSAERESGADRSVKDSRSRSQEFSKNIGEFAFGTAERREGISRVGEQQQETRSRQFSNGGNVERMGRQVQHASGKADSIGEEQRANIKEQRSINEKLTAIRDRIRAVVQNIRTRFSKTAEPDRELEKPTSEPIKQQRSEPTMGAMSRFNEIARNQERARQEQTDKEKEKATSTETASGNSNTEQERPSVLEKLRKYEQETKEGRTEQLQSEKNQEQQHQDTIRRRGRHR